MRPLLMQRIECQPAKACAGGSEEIAASGHYKPWVEDYKVENGVHVRGPNWPLLELRR
jgi:hypothetical protein